MLALLHCTFTIPFAEKITEQSAPAIDLERERREREAAEDARRAALRAHGTFVTVQTFAAWKARFDAEMALEKARLLEANKVDCCATEAAPSRAAATAGAIAPVLHHCSCGMIIVET